MTGAVLPPLLLTGLLVLFALATRWLARRVPHESNELVDAIDALLPQTQCAQCGFAGCRPYAEALAAGTTAPNLCPPGGATVHAELVALLGRDAGDAPVSAPPMLAVIDEAECIGCTLCLPPCPVDAIVGAQGVMHTVLTTECTGCELCVPACPVDCITLVTLPTPAAPAPRRRIPLVPAPEHACIHCGQCDTACPVNLPAHDLLTLVRADNLTVAATRGLADCIECGLCDRVCPSGIAMADAFAHARARQRDADAADADKARFKARFAAHEARAAERQDATRAKRAARLKAGRRWT